MKKNNVSLLTLLLTLGMVMPLTSCGDAPSSSDLSSQDESSDTTSDTNSTSENEEEENGSGIHAKEENDFLEYDEFRPPRDPFVDETPLDEGELVDHFYQFEEMNIKSNGSDPYCGTYSFTYSPLFMEHLALENLAGITDLTLTITSDKAVRVPMEIQMAVNYARGASLSQSMPITNNNKKLVDLSVCLPQRGQDAPYAPGGYWEIAKVTTMISLVEGKNKINFHPENGVNVDYVNIKTSANIVNITKPYYEAIDIDLLNVPTKDNDGTILLTDNLRDCDRIITRPIAKLSDPSWDKLSLDGIDTYHTVFGKRDIYVADLPDIKKDARITDKSELKDNVFEIESAQISGNSTKDDFTSNNHFCASDALVVNPSYSGDALIEDLRKGNEVTFKINSNQDVIVPFTLGMKNAGGRPISSLLDMTNNDKTDMVITNRPSTSKGIYQPDLGEYKGKVNMGEASGLIHLVNGENTIKMVMKDTVDLDYLNIMTSAKLTNKTTPTLADYTVKMDKAPEFVDGGNITITCSKDKCEKVKSCYLPNLKDKGYSKKDAGNNKTTYYITVLGRSIDIATVDMPSIPDDEGPLKDHYFEFENAAVTGDGSRNGCAPICGGSIYVHPHFSGMAAIDFMGANTTFTWTFTSDKSVNIPFAIGVSTTVAYNRTTQECFDIKINGNGNGVDASNKINGEVKHMPFIHDFREQYFRMCEATGTLPIKEGQNTISITLKYNDLNIDYLKLSTSATLNDLTVATLSGDKLPEINVTNSPTQTDYGRITFNCKTRPNCEQFNDVGILPPLGEENHGYIVENGDGVTNYYIVVLHQKILVASVAN